MKRHYEGVHAKDRSEDHLAHLIWGFMAINHVAAVFPQCNDLTNFEELRRRNVALEAARDPTLLEIVGDGGFRSASKFQSSPTRDPRTKIQTQPPNLENELRAHWRHTSSFLFPPEQ